MTDEENTEEIILTPAHKNRWYIFAESTKEFDFQKDKPDGWHWFWGLYYIYNTMCEGRSIELAPIQKELPEGHWLKKVDDAALKEIEISSEYDILISLLEYYFSERDESPSLIDFSKLHFDEGAYFNGFIFPLAVSFKYAKFSDDTDFCDAVFFGEVRFDDAIFSKNATFRKTIFSEGSSFYNAMFYDTVEFTGSTFSIIASFRASRFFGFSDFSNTIFTGHVTFVDVQFEKHVPHFYNAKISADILWEKDIKCWPQLKNHEFQNIKAALRYNQTAYEALVYHMKTLDKHHDEHFFFRQEMRCRRKSEENRFIRFSYWLYEKSADYGYGAERAAAFWFLHILIGVLVIVFIAMCGGIRYHESLSCAIPVSFTNANPYALFSFDSVRLAECYDMFNVHAPILFALVKVIQTILGVGLLFLVLLTLRVRFRLK